MLTILTFLIILSLLIFVHELGHFIAARLMGIRVEEFAFGLPFTKPIFTKKFKKLKISFYPIFFGGFVKMLGEEQKELESKKIPKDAFCAKSPLARTFVITAGVLMNFLLAVAVISFMLTKGVYIPSDKIHLENVMANTPAHSSGLKKGDVIEKIDKKSIKSPNDLVSYTNKKLGEKVVLEVKRGEKRLKITLTPRKKYPPDQGPMGVAISNLNLKKYPWYQAPFYAFAETVKLSVIICQAIFQMIKSLVQTGNLPKDIAGPVGVAQLTGQAVKFGYMAVLQLLALLSINLAIFNILPFPALDGGRLLFVSAEVIFGKKIAPKVENIINTAGMAILFGLIIIITINDLDRIINFSKLISPLMPKF